MLSSACICGQYDACFHFGTSLATSLVNSFILTALVISFGSRNVYVLGINTTAVVNASGSGNVKLRNATGASVTNPTCFAERLQALATTQHSLQE